MSAAKADKASGKAKGAKDGKQAKGAKDAAGGERTPRVIAHPRAQDAIRRAKGWGALLGFVVAAVAGLRAGTPLLDTGVRALACGMAGYVLAWAGAVQVWRHVVVAEIRGVHTRVAEEAAAATAAAQAAEAEPAAAGARR